MKTKILKLVVACTFLQICLYACCTDVNNIFLSTVDFTVRDSADNDITSVTNADFSLLAKTDYDFSLVTSLAKQSGLLNMAYATSCDEEFIITKLVTNVELTADVPLFGIDAGNSLNDHVLVGFGVVSGDTGFSMNDMKNALNYEINNIYEDYFLTFDTTIPTETTTTFTLTITFENDEQLTRVSTPVTFQ
ncbi:hypothetical protein KORDIASMS9_03865 [Kordia sp. SMS9]|uniref:hypothetical protein n=1 Tax=Kordia sp. SMS9 TaxID=2282170 RepID=UPI000E0CE75C|nr:hypothetical protein [Kordia sp. SMS9]AXG71608.1 hypothetical protein KORDIASMS9_03865 [Kordia sp. SMS9]